MIKRLLLSALLLLTYTFASAQPANDSCANAIALTVGTGICSSIQYDNTGATPELNDPIPTCWAPASIDNNVWFTFVPDSSRVHISTNFSYSLNNTQVAVFSGTCGALTEIACQEDFAASSSHVELTVVGLTIGNTYYIMVDGNGIGNVGTFGICVENLAPPPAALPSEDCFTATYLCDTTMISVATNTHTSGSIGDPQETPYCFPFGSGDPGAYWYQFTALTSGNLCFDLYANDGSTDYDWAVYDVSFGCPGFALDCDHTASLAIATGLGCGSVACHPCLPIGANSTYAILVSRRTNNSTGFTLNFTTTTALFGGVPIPNFNHGDSVCVGQSLAFTNTTTTQNQNLSFFWDFGDSYTSTSTNPTHAYTAPGVYTVTLIATCNSNSNVTTSTVHILPSLVASVTPPTATICNGSSVALQGTAAFDSLLQVPQAFTNTTDVPIPDFPAPAVSSNITVSGVQPNLFFANPVVSVCFNINHTFDGDLQARLIAPDLTYIYLILNNGGGGSNFTGTCFTPGSTTSINFGSPPFTGDWYPIDSFQTLNNTPINGVWTLEIVDVAGGDVGTLLDWSITFNSQNYLTYTWTPSTGLSSTSTDTTTASPNATTTYTFLATDARGCPGSATAQVNVINTPQSTFSINSDTLCTDEVATVMYTGLASATATYTWDLGNATTISGSGLPTDPYFLSWPSGQNDTISLVVQDSSCTSVTTYMYITVNPKPTVDAGPDFTVCEGTPINLTATSNPSAGASFSWLGPGGFNSTAQNPTIPVSTSAMTGLYSVTSTVNGCPSDPDTSSMVFVSVVPAPVGTAFSNSPVCDEGTIQLSTDTLLGGSYSWSGPNSFTNTNQNPSISPANMATDAGTYTVTISVAGCVTSSTTTVTMVALPNPVLGSSNSPICEGSDLFLFADSLGGETYSWTGPNGFTDTLQNPTRPGALPADAGQYYVTRTVGGCTSHVDTVNVTVDQKIFATLPAQEIHTCMLDTVITANDPSPGFGIWSLVSGTGVIQNPNNFSTVVTGVDTGISVYRWMVINGTCSDSIHLTVVHDGIDTCGTLETNELITPNNDNLNESLKFTGLFQYPDNKLVIFNRWGNKVFSKNGYRNNWMGRTEEETKGDQLPDGTYYYILTIPGQKAIKGFVEVRK